MRRLNKRDLNSIESMYVAGLGLVLLTIVLMLGFFVSIP